MSFPPTYYVHAKHSSGKQPVAVFMRLHQANKLELTDAMEPIEIIVYNEKLGINPEIARYRILPYELFKN